MPGVRVMSFNANGLRAAYRKGFEAFLAEVGADVLCLQEVKAHTSKLCPCPAGYRAHWHLAERKGYSGVGLLSRAAPERVRSGMGHAAYDAEGRVLQAEFGAVTVLSVYVPSGSSSEARHAFKMRFLEDFRTHVARLLAEGRELLVCGDLNVAHQRVDLKNWRSNQQTSGFLPEERAWFSELLALGLIDTVRQLAGPETPVYSWWSLRSGARSRNVGWRLDYQLATPALAAAARWMHVPREPVLSDHAPVIVEYQGFGS